LSGNPEYRDLRNLTWEDAEQAYAAERTLLGKLDAVRTAEDLKALRPAVAACGLQTFRLDLGVASAVCALSAAGLVPLSSCNAGAFGAAHPEPHPVVSFFAYPSVLPLLKTCARRAQIGLGTSALGGAIAYSNDIRRMRQFAKNLMKHADLFPGAPPTKR
jgi:hypothetical protein